MKILSTITHPWGIVCHIRIISALSPSPFRVCLGFVDDSLTDLDEFQSHLEDSLYNETEELTVTSSNVSTLSKKQSRNYRRQARQAQHKRYVWFDLFFLLEELHC